MSKVSSATSANSTSNTYVPPKDKEEDKKKTETKNNTKKVTTKTVSPYPANSGTNSNDNKSKTEPSTGRKTISPYDSGVNLTKKTDATTSSSTNTTSTKTDTKTGGSNTTTTDLTDSKKGLTGTVDTNSVSLKQTTGKSGDGETDTTGGKLTATVGTGDSKTSATDLTKVSSFVNQDKAKAENTANEVTETAGNAFETTGKSGDGETDTTGGKLTATVGTGDSKTSATDLTKVSSFVNQDKAKAENTANEVTETAGNAFETTGKSGDGETDTTGGKLTATVGTGDSKTSATDLTKVSSFVNQDKAKAENTANEVTETAGNAFETTAKSGDGETDTTGGKLTATVGTGDSKTSATDLTKVSSFVNQDKAKAENTANEVTETAGNAFETTGKSGDGKTDTTGGKLTATVGTGDSKTSATDLTKVSSFVNQDKAKAENTANEVTETAGNAFETTGKSGDGETDTTGGKLTATVGTGDSKTSATDLTKVSSFVNQDKAKAENTANEVTETAGNAFESTGKSGDGETDTTGGKLTATMGTGDSKTSTTDLTKVSSFVNQDKAKAENTANEVTETAGNAFESTGKSGDGETDTTGGKLTATMGTGDSKTSTTDLTKVSSFVNQDKAKAENTANEVKDATGDVWTSSNETEDTSTDTTDPDESETSQVANSTAETDDTKDTSETDDTKDTTETDDTKDTTETDDTKDTTETDDTKDTTETDDTKDTTETDDTKDTTETNDTKDTTETDDTKDTTETDDTKDTTETDDTKDTTETDDTKDTTETDDTEESDETKESQVANSTADTEGTDDTKDTQETDDTKETDSQVADSTATDDQIIGYDEDGKPITESEYEKSKPTSKLAEQTVDEAIANGELQVVFDMFNENEKLGREVFAYLDKKYKDVPRTTDQLDIYANPQNYTPEQKLIQYIDLINLEGQYQQYKAYMETPNTGTGGTIKNQKEIENDIAKAQETLLQDSTTSALLTSEYLAGVGKILAGERFSDEEDFYDADYAASLDKLRSNLEARYDDQITEGKLFVETGQQGANERTIFTKYNTDTTIYSALLSQEFLDSRNEQVEKVYDQVYTELALPLTPEAPDALLDLTYNINKASLSPEELKNVGLSTPTVNGQDYVDLVGKNLNTSNLSNWYGKQELDDKTKQQIADLGLDGKIEGDGFDAAYIPTVSNITDQVFGSDGKNSKERTEFANTLMTELRPLMEKVDAGMTTDELSTYLKGVQSEIGKGSMAEYSDQISTALTGIVRGASLTNDLLLSGLGNSVIAEGNAARNDKNVSLVDLQASLSLASGYEGRGLSKVEGADGELAGTIFGTDGRKWESGMISRFGEDTMQTYSDNMTEGFRGELRGANVSDVTYDLFGYTKAVEEKLGTPLANAIGESLYADNPEALAKYNTNVPNLMHHLWGLAKPGGSTERFLKQVQDLVSMEGGAFSDGSTPLSDQKKSFSKWTSAFFVGTRTIYGGTIANTSDPNAMAGLALYAAQGAGQVLGLANMTLPDPGMDARTLTKLGNYSDAALRASKTFSGKASGVLGGLVDIGYLPVDISTFVAGMKNGNYDTAEKIFQGFILGTDIGVAVDGAMSVARSLLPASTLATSRLSSFFFGAGGAAMSAVGAAFTFLNVIALMGLNFYQDFKESDHERKLRSALDDNLWRLTGNAISGHVGPYPGGADPWATDEQKQKELEYLLYKEDVTPVDWDAIQENNRKRREEAVEQSQAA